MKHDTTKIAPASPTARNFKVVLVEDKEEIRSGWSRLINSFPGFTCVCACTSGEDALRTIPGIRPDVVLMDIFLPRMSGIECTARLKQLLPEVQILILTAVDDNDLVFMALQAGADGFLLKRTKPADLRAALLEVLQGGAPMTSEIARRVVSSFRRPPKTESQTVHLSTREEQVLILLSKGYANKEIANELSLSVETVGSHLKHIYEKLHVRSRAEAVARYVSENTLDWRPR
jgi:DNA-binding NarL/FixJ family response regulator